MPGVISCLSLCPSHVNLTGIHRIESERYCRFRFRISVKKKWTELISVPLNLVSFYRYDVGEVLTVDPSLTQMFQLPSVIAMSIAATRIYRKLADYVYRPTDMCFFLRFLCLLRSLSSMICRLLVSLQMRNEQSITNVDGQLGDNSHGSNLDSDLERAMENPVPR
jgi:hypothetical protein